MVAEKKGNVTLSSQAEKANMRLHISAFLQLENTHCYKKNGQMIKDRKRALKKQNSDFGSYETSYKKILSGMTCVKAV